MLGVNYPEPFNKENTVFKRGDKVVNKDGAIGTVLGPEDYDGYEYNRPSKKWELVRVESLPEPYRTTWHGNIWIKKIKEEN